MASYLFQRYHQREQEVAGAVYLDARRHLIETRELTRGISYKAPVETRLFLRPALENGAQAMVIFHTHPSGNPAPSAEDLAFTHQLAKAGEIVGIQLLDHLILGSSNLFVSLRSDIPQERRRILPETQTSIPGEPAGQEGGAAQC